MAGADARGFETLRIRLVADYAREPLTLLTTNQSAYHVVVDQLWLHAMASFALHHRWLFALDVPLLVRQSGDAPSALATPLQNPGNGPSVGDWRAMARVRLLGPASEGIKLSAGAEVWLPNGTASSYGTDGAVRVHAFASTGEHDDRFSWALNLGLLLRPAQQLPSLLPVRTGKALTWAAATLFALDAASHLHAGPELRAETVFGDGAKLLDPRSSTLQLLATVAWRIAGSPLEATVSFGPGIAQGAGSADYRALLALGWSPEAPPPQPDRDDDTVADEADACANLPGAPSSDPLMNGCPEVPSDFDGDAIADAHDACPKIPGIPTAIRKTHGCPKIADADSDQVANAEDACPTVAGVASKVAAEHGCPKRLQAPPQAKWVERQITISEQVLFETGTANIEPSSHAILREVARVLSRHPEIELLEVQGHTDNVGTNELNLTLSQERARAVMTWLAEHGIEAKRLIAKGYGTRQPIANNETEEGRTQNRRVEFRILRTTSEAGKP